MVPLLSARFYGIKGAPKQCAGASGATPSDDAAKDQGKPGPCRAFVTSRVTRRAAFSAFNAEIDPALHPNPRFISLSLMHSKVAFVKAGGVAQLVGCLPEFDSWHPIKSPRCDS